MSPYITTHPPYAPLLCCIPHSLVIFTSSSLAVLLSLSLYFLLQTPLWYFCCETRTFTTPSQCSFLQRDSPHWLFIVFSTDPNKGLFMANIKRPAGRVASWVELLEVNASTLPSNSAPSAVSHGRSLKRQRWISTMNQFRLNKSEYTKSFLLPLVSNSNPYQAPYTCIMGWELFS